jgi:hypothetical protein
MTLGKVDMNNVITLENLIGTWKLVKTDKDIDVEDGVAMVIDPDGKIVYILHSGKKQQIINLTFRLEKDLVISDQPSRPQEQKTKVTFDRGYLLFDYADSKAWFEREL